MLRREQVEECSPCLTVPEGSVVVDGGRGSPWSGKALLVPEVNQKQVFTEGPSASMHVHTVCMHACL